MFGRGRASDKREQASPVNLQLLRHAVGSALDSVVITDLDGKILFVNQACLDRFGYREDELVGQNVSVLQSPHNPDGYCKAAHEATLRNGWSGEMVDITKDGREFTIHLTSTVVKDEHGAPVAAVGIGRDLSQIRQTERSLRATQEFLTSLLEHTPAAMYVMSLDDRFLVVNRAWEEFTGKSREQVLGCQAKDVFPEEVARRFSDTSQSVVNSKGAITVEQRVEMPDGPHFFHTVKFPLRDSAGNIEAVAGVSFDITKRKLVEQALAREYDLMRALMNQMPDTIYFKDAACRFTRVNAAQAHVLGIADPKQAIGKTDADFFAPDFAREARADDQTVLRTKRPIINKTERVVRLDGHACWMQATKVPVLDSEGNVTGLVGISRETAAPPSAPPSAKILIVEDEANIRDLQSQLLELEGFRVLTARDGVEGLLRFREHAQDIDLVITDLAMPQMTGEVMIAEIRKLSSAVPILVLSGFAKPETQKQLNKCGVSGFISKPFTGDMLLQKIRAVLAAAR